MTKDRLQDCAQPSVSGNGTIMKIPMLLAHIAHIHAGAGFFLILFALCLSLALIFVGGSKTKHK
jgi:hypothetical protein